MVDRCPCFKQVNFKGECSSCVDNKTHCAIMGVDTDDVGNSKLFLNTRGIYPFCGESFIVNVERLLTVCFSTHVCGGHNDKRRFPAANGKI